MTEPTDPPKSLWQMIVGNCALPALFLLPVLGVQLWSLWWGQDADLLKREGVVATATVTDVEQWIERALDNNDSSSNRGIETTFVRVSYRFTVEADGRIVEDEYTTRDLVDPPVVGDEFDVRYASSDPAVHETSAGHYERNTSALHYIALFFAGLFTLMIVYGCYDAVRTYGSTAEKARRRRALLHDA